MQHSSDIKDQILQRTDLVELISEVIDLRKRGSNFIGLCPFHNEKTPSFTVSLDKGIYKCFGCGAAGNAFSFMMNYHRMSFSEAIAELARRAGISLPEQSKLQHSDQIKLSQSEAIIKVLDAASQFFHSMLKTNAGKTASTYFNKRNFSTDLIKYFGLGYSPDSYDATIKELTKQGFNENVIQEAGLIVKNEEKNSHYDRFRGRVMFPIQDIFGKVIGFGARRLNDDDSQPKYINSPQTLVYDKSRTLYGLYQARNELRQKKFAILVEGYADVLTLHQAGYINSVASSGTSLTIEQLQILSKYCHTLYIVYDADTAGVKAAERGLELAIEKGFDVFIVQLPSGEDPDSIIRENGGKIFQSYLSKPISFIDFKVELMKKQNLLSTPAGKADAARELLKIISKIPDRLQHDDHINHLSTVLNLSENQLQQIYIEKNKIERKQRISVLPKESLPSQQEIKTQNDYKNINKSSASQQKEFIKFQLSKMLPEELFLLTLAIIDGNAFKILNQKFTKNQGIFLSEEPKRLFLVLNNISKTSHSLIQSIISNEEIDEFDKEFFVTIALDEHHLSEYWDKFRSEIPKIDIKRSINDSLVRIELNAVEQQLSITQSLQKNAKNIDEQLAELKIICELNEKKLNLLSKLRYE